MSDTGADEIALDLRLVWRMFWPRWWLVVALAGVALPVGLGLTLVWPKKYEATVTVFPVGSSGSSSLSDYSGLASLAGIQLPSGGSTSTPGKTVSALLSSRLLAVTVVRDLKLAKAGAAGAPSDSTEEISFASRIRSSMRVAEESRTGVISISVRDRDPGFAQTIANYIPVALDNLLVEKALTSSQKQRRLIEKQVGEQSAKVTQLQRQLADFQKQTTLLSPVAQAGKAIDNYTAMIQQKMALELQLATAQSSYSPDNPKLTILLSQIRSLTDQIDQVKNQVDGDLPSLRLAPDNLIQFQNLTRDLEIATKIYAGLLSGLEQLRLEKDRDQVFVEVLDAALPPVVPIPNNSMIVAVTVVVGAMLGVALALVLGILDERRRNSTLAPLGENLPGDLRSREGDVGR